MQTVLSVNKRESIKVEMNNRTFEYIKRKEEVRLKRKLLKDIILSNLTSTNKCMSCLHDATQTYPLYLCDECFSLLFSPKTSFFSTFIHFFKRYSNATEISELKKLHECLESHGDTMYRNLDDAVIKKMRGVLDEKMKRQKLILLKEQIRHYNRLYFETDVKNGIDSLIVIKKLILALEDEILSLEREVYVE